MSTYARIDHELLTTERKRRGWSTRHVAHKLKGLGAAHSSPQSVLNHESGNRRPHPRTAALYAALYSLDLSKLIREPLTRRH